MLNRFLYGPLRAEDDDGGGGSDKGITEEAVKKLIADTLQDKLNALDASNTKARKKLEDKLTESLAAITTKLEALKPEEGDDDDDADKKDEDGAGIPAEISSKIRNLERQNAKAKELQDGLQKRLDEAETKSKQQALDGAVRKALGEHTFRDADSMELAYEAIRHKATVDEDGKVVIKDGDSEVLVTEYVAGKVEGSLGYLLKSSEGAGTGTGEPGKRGSDSFSSDRIKPGMSEEDAKEAWNALGRVVQ